jgi:hypothetical protein
MKKFKPTNEIVQAASTVFVAMALVQTIRPVVIGIQTKVLLKGHYKYSNDLALKLIDRGEIFPDYVTNPDHTYLMNDKDFQDYLTKCKQYELESGLKTENPEFCPLLVAESMEREAKHCLIEVMEPITKITLDMATHNLENYRKLVELTLKLLAPYVKNKAA